MCLLFISKNVWQSKHSIIKSSMTEKVLSKLCLLRLTTKACAVANLTHAYTSSKFVILHSTTPASKWNVNRIEILERFLNVVWATFFKDDMKKKRIKLSLCYMGGNIDQIILQFGVIVNYASNTNKFLMTGSFSRSSIKFLLCR